MWRGLITAIRTLTILPVPGRDANHLSASLPWFPVVGALLGVIQYGLAIGLQKLTGYGWQEGAAVVLVLSGCLLTRGLHLDGLADWADGFWGGHDREKVLAIMKDSRIGAFGGIALAVILLAKWVCLTKILATYQESWLPAVYVVSRALQVDLMVAQPYARAEGGTARSFVEGAGWFEWLAVFGLTVAALLLVFDLARPIWCAAIAAWLLARLFGMWCRNRVGGITGDLIGAGSELTETFLLACAAFAGVWCV